MKSSLKTLFILVIFSVVPTFLIWLPFFLRLNTFWGIPLVKNGMATIIANYDGPLYIVVAKTLYNPISILGSFQFTLPAQYYAAHFPLFPILIKLGSPFLGTPYAMLTTTLLSSILSLFFFHKLVLKYTDNKNHALWLTFIFSIFPARWLIVRSVGSPEPLFMAAIIASIYYFREKKYLLAGVWGAIAQLTKSPGILLFFAYAGFVLLPMEKNLVKFKFNNLLKSLNLKLMFTLLIPISLLGIFFVYKFTYNDFFAYFHSGDNIHLIFPPFEIFNYSQPWVGTFWLEEVIFIYLFGVLGFLNLVKQKEKLLAWFVGIFFFTTIFVSHRDLLRYSLPIIPFVIISFRDYLVKKEFRIALFFILIPIYLFSLAFITQNVMQISNWAPLL